MKRGKMKHFMLKRILVLAFIISLLSNHMLVLTEAANMALATEVEWNSEFTSDVRTDEIQENEENSDNQELENEVENTTENDEITIPEDENSESENEEAEPSEENVDVNEEEVEVKELTEEEIEALKDIKVNTDLNINKLIKFDNENGKGTLADVTFKFNVSTMGYEVNNLTVNFDLPNISGIAPSMYRVEEISDNIDLVEEEGTNRRIANISEVIDNYDEEIRLVLAYSENSISGEEIELLGDVRLEAYGYEILGDFEEHKEIVESNDVLATYEVKSDAASKYKGCLYANTVLENKKETLYSTTDVVEIKDANFIDEIIVENSIDKIVADEREIDLVNLSTYKATSVAVEEFDSVLGTNGYIEIYNQLGEKIGDITSDSEIRNDKYIYYYNTDVDRTIFKIKNAESNGTLNIKNEKAIKGSDTFSRDYVKSFKGIKTQVTNKVAKIFEENEVVIQNISSENIINLEETESKMTLEMNTNDLITTEQNEVTFTATFQTNEERYELFRNPTISIELPSAVENAEIKSVNLMYKNGLSLGNWQVVKNAQGLNEIQVALTGTQTEYEPGTLIEGTTVLITANLDLNKITANGKSAVKFRYTNEIATNIAYETEGKVSEDIEVNYVSRSGILKETKLENFNKENDILITYNDETVVGKIDAATTAQTAKVSTVIMNNYNEDINNVQIIGKIPAVGNTKDNVDLNTTFDTKLTGAVNLNGLVGKVYYSTEENPDKNSNTWKENVNDFSEIKSFKVTLNNNSMKVGERVEISYNLNIPENIGYNQTAYNLFTTYYNLNNQEMTDSSIVGLETEVKAVELEDCQVVEETPELNIGTQVTKAGTVLQEGEEVNEGQILRYNVVLENKTSKPITNINLNGLAENTNSYYWYTYKDINSTTHEEDLIGIWKEDTENEHIYETSKIDILNPGEKAVFSYQARVRKISEMSTPEVYGKITISADGIQEKEYQTIKNKVINGELQLTLSNSGAQLANDSDLYSTNLLLLHTAVKNIGDRDLENVTVNVMIPKLLEVNLTETGIYNEGVDISKQDTSSGCMVTFSILNIPKGETKDIIVSSTIGSLDLSIAETTISMSANSNIDGKLYLSNDYVKRVIQAESPLNIIYTSTPENGSIVKNGDNVKYNIIIQNTGLAERPVDFSDFIDDGLKINSAVLTLPDGTQENMEFSEYEFISTYKFLKPGEQLVVDVDATVDVENLRTGQTSIDSELQLVPSDNVSDIAEIILHVDPSEIKTLPDGGTADDDNEPDDDGNNNDNDNTNNDGNNSEDKPDNFEDKVNTVVPETPDFVLPDTPKNDDSNTDKNNNSETKEDTNLPEVNATVSPDNNQNINIEDNVTNNIDNLANTVKYSISGKAWLDSNKNGLYEEEEALESIKVMLFKTDSLETSQIKDSNVLKTGKTDENGEYTFNNLDVGKYVVVFDYDNSIYDVSTYQEIGSSNSKSSNVIAKQLTLNSNKKNYAVSDIVEISERNANVNIGLKENSDFDMGISTYVKKVTIENEKGTQTENFTDGDRLAKIEIPAKYVNSSKVTVEYVVKVTNNGKTAGYINQICDYIPEGLKFNEKASSNWQVGENNAVYTSALNKTLINPGESKEITLVLTKSMDERATGVYKNIAEIVKSTNDLQLSDYDENNDSSIVELLITIKTGAVYYILIVIIALALAFIAMLIVSKLLKNDKDKIKLINRIIILVSIVIIVSLCLIVNTYAIKIMSVVKETLGGYFAGRYDLNSDLTYTTSEMHEGEGYTTVQCVHGVNVSNAVGTRTIATDVKIGYGNSALGFDTSSINGSKSGDSIVAGRMACLAYLFEQGQGTKGTLGSYINRSGGKSDLSSLFNVSITGSASNYSGADTVSTAINEANRLKREGSGVTKVTNISKLEYNSTYDGFGAVNVKFPSNAKLKISTDGGNSYTDYNKKVITAYGLKNFSYDNCNGKAFYIPIDAFGDADLEKVKVKIEGQSTLYKARILGGFIRVVGGQNEVIMRGKKDTKTTKQEYTLNAIANVSVSKTVTAVTDANGNQKTNLGSKGYVDRGDRVCFTIKVINKGMPVKLDITDTYNTSQYTFISSNLAGGSSSNGRLTSKNLSISKGTYTFTVWLKVKDNVRANGSTELRNTVNISNFKLPNGKPIKNVPKNKVTDFDYVRCKQYRISVTKTVDVITSTGTPKSTQNSVEVGDFVKYKIVVKNNEGSNSAAYGRISYTMTEDVPNGFSVQKEFTSAGWIEQSGKYVYSGTLDSGGTQITYITMRVTEELLSKQAINRKNVVNIISSFNRNNIDLIKGNYLISSDLDSEAIVKILGYNMGISKAVTKINDGKVTDLTKCELGDKITYTINVKNTGANTANFGNIKNIVLDDTFKTNELKLLSATGNGWKKSSDTRYIYEGALAPGETATLTMNFEVILESKQKVKITNTGTVISTLNKNGILLTPLIPATSSATVEYQTYDMGVWKYISSANSVPITGRDAKTNQQKYDSPIEVEKYDNVVYTIKVQNTGTTIVNNITLVDTLETGLTFKEILSVKKYGASGAEDSTTSQITQEINGNKITFKYPGEVKSNEYFVIQIKCDITMSNMYLLNLKNELDITSLHNRNDIDLIPKDLVNYTTNDNIDYVRLKNLIISGKVWIDANRDGKMDDAEGKLSGIKVVLHDDTNKKVATTYTEADGTYKFGETNGTTDAGAESNKKMVEGGINSGRVIKATNRDDITGNYNSTSAYINYYVEFYYNGANYISTVYAGEDGKANINKADNSISMPYMTDSNANEYTDVRDNFNNSLETIEYNTGINGVVESPDNTKTLSYTKDKHNSTLDLTDSTGMSAYSFIIKSKPHNGQIVNGDNINMLYFSHSGETEYLKYINLGLQTKEMDLNIEEDVYNLKTTVNGTEMTYFFGQKHVNNSPFGGDYVTGGENSALNYSFKVYASDYYYKHTQYVNDDVKEYKEKTELNTEITYKMTIANNDVKDANNVYSRIREIADFYSSDFKAYDPNNNTKVIKVLGEDGYLHEKTVNKVEAWYEYVDKSNNKQTGEVKLSNTPTYPKHSKVNLENGKYNTVYLSGFDNIKLTQGESFDIYIKFVVDTKDGTDLTDIKLGEKNNVVEINAYSTYYPDDRPAGFVDKNSNPGNLGLKTDANKSAGNENNSIQDYSEYENDAYKTGITLSILSSESGEPVPPPSGEEPPTGSEKGNNLERNVKGTVWDDARSAIAGNGGNTQYLGNGIKNIGVDEKIREAESNKKKGRAGRLLVDETKDSPAEGINVNLVEIIKLPKNNEERIYEESVKTWSDSIINTRTASDGSYKLESFIPGDYIVRFNYGESVEDVVYNGQEYKSTKYYNVDSYITEEPSSGDKVLAELEKEQNSDARDDEIRRLEVIKWSETVNNRKTEEAQKSLPQDYSEDFMKNTSMKAETVAFPVRAEKTTYDVIEYTFDEYIERINRDSRYKIENIDFGVEYRPEVNVSIKEFISRIQLTTSDGKALADIKFDNVYEQDSNRIINTVINEENSIGFENLQYLPTVAEVKGLAYLNVDEDLLQGCTVDVTYVFSVNNGSEIDRISERLYNLRYKADASGYEAYYDDTYTAAGTARNELYKSFYAKDRAEYRTKDKMTFNGTDGYYGKYLGETYYTGSVGAKDVVAELKVDKILDYVDNNMLMESNKNTETNKHWNSMTDQELMDQGLIADRLFNTVNEENKVNGEIQIKSSKKLLDAKGIIYDVDTRHNLAVSVDDKISSTDSNNMNKLLSIFLKPHVLNKQASSGEIYMVASKVVAGEADTENMTYDNSAEIIQYTSVTGRVTTLATTVGNLNMNSNPEYEADSAFTERVTLTPPTGLEKSKYYISLAMDEIIIVTIVIGVIIIAIVLKKNISKISFKKFYK